MYFSLENENKQTNQNQTEFGTESLPLAYTCTHVLNFRNFTLGEKTLPWRQKGLGSTIYLLITVLTGFWP